MGDAYADNLVLEVIKHLLIELIKTDDRNPLLEKNSLGIIICKNGYLPIFVAEYCNINFQIIKISAGSTNNLSKNQLKKLSKYAEHCDVPIIFTERNPKYDEMIGTFVKGEDVGISIVSDISVSASYRVVPKHGLLRNLPVEGLLIYLFGINRSSSIDDCIIPFDEVERKKKFPRAFENIWNN